MPPVYDNTVKEARLNATRQVFSGGALELIDNDGKTLASLPLSLSGGTVSGDTWDVTLRQYTTQALFGNNTKVVGARVVTREGKARLTGLTAGTGQADVVLTHSTLTKGQDVRVNTFKIVHA